MQKQTMFMDFESYDMRDYAYSVAIQLNKLIDGKAEPVYNRAGLWDIKIEFNKITTRWRGSLVGYYEQGYMPNTAATAIIEYVIKEITDALLKRR